MENDKTEKKRGTVIYSFGQLYFNSVRLYTFSFLLHGDTAILKELHIQAHMSKLSLHHEYIII